MVGRYLMHDDMFACGHGIGRPYDILWSAGTTYVVTQINMLIIGQYHMHDDMFTFVHGIGWSYDIL
jgi:hypothetical protein